jgi:hypothetical protein
MCDDNTLSLMIRINHAFKVDRLTCEMRVSGGFPSMLRTRLRFIIGSTARITTDAPDAPAKFRTVTRETAFPQYPRDDGARRVCMASKP